MRIMAVQFVFVVQLLAQKTGVDLNLSDLKQLVGREISSCLQPGRHLVNAEQQLSKLSATEQQHLGKLSSSTEQLPKLSSDVTLTKVAAPERLSEKDKDVKVCSTVFAIFDKDVDHKVVVISS